MKKNLLIILITLFSKLAFSQTTLYPGDLAVIAFNFNVDDDLSGTLASSSDDRISFVCFKAITVGTTIDFTDNGYERVTAGQWGDTEGGIRITWNGASSIPAGTIITIEFEQSATVKCINPATGWTSTNLGTGAAATGLDMNTSTGDQLIIMQGGTWTAGAAAHDGVYSGGRFLFGVNTAGVAGWAAAPNYNTTSNSTLPDNIYCLNLTISGHFVEYTGATTSTTQYGWLTRLKNIANFTTRTTSDLYFSTAPNYETVTTSIPFSGISTPGIWVGTNTNWYDCTNWENLQVPDNSTDVLIPNTPNDAVVSYTAAFSDIYSDTAYCKNINITADKVVVDADVRNVLKVYGNLTINTGGELDMSDGITGTPDGLLYLYGNWDNRNDETWFKEGESTVLYVGSTDQTVSIATGTVEPYYNLTVNKPAGVIICNDDIQVDKNETSTGGVLKLISGKINANGKNVWVSTSTSNAIQNHNVNSYVYGGTLKRLVVANTSYDFPVGSSSNYQLATINLASGASISGSPDYINTFFTSPNTGTTPGALTESGNTYNLLLNAGFWTITPSSTFTGSYSVTLNERGYSNGGATSYTVLKRDDASSAWGIYGTAGTWSEVASVVTTNRTGITSFSDFAIGLAGILPVSLLNFTGMPVGNDVRLEWNTVAEEKIWKYEIEASYNGVDFEKIGEVFSHVKQTNNKYDFIDKNAINGKNYYRLKIVEENEIYMYSTKIMVLFSNQQNLTTVYPNPSEGKFSIVSSKEIVQTKIYDVAGREVYADSVKTFTLNPDLSALAKGTYLLRIEYSDTNIVPETLKINLK